MQDNQRLEHPKSYRYPGPYSFRDDETDSLVFFGRDEEIAEVLNRLLSAKLLVMYAKSGLGKTSLLQAGLFPKLRELNYLPIRLRFIDGKPPLEALRSAVAETCKAQQIAYSEGHGDSYWEFFNSAIFSKGQHFLKPVLILDQFEEIFTLNQNQNHRQILAEQLGDLLSGQMPESLRNRLREGHKPDYSLRPPEVRVLISLREDSLGALQELATQIPGILSEVFRLTPLDLARARKAIVQPAALVAPSRFYSKPFSFQTAMVDALLTHMKDKRGNIEPFELQLLCRHVELQVVARQAESNETPEVDLQTYLGGEAGMDKVVNQFYRSAIGRLDSWHTRRKAKRLCETGLLNSEGRRESLSRNQIKHQFNLKDAVLKQLVESKVLRREERLDDYAYELSHDSLASTVFKARKAHLRLKWVLTTVPVILALAATLVWQSLQIEQKDIRVDTALEEYKIQVRENVELDNPADPKRRTIKQPAMTVLRAGQFVMGSKSGDKDETPPHRVTVAAFAIGTYEVTFEEYDQFAATELDRLPGDEGWGRGKRPVINVSWQEATQYAAWLSKKTGKRYRLPTEAEWEYAARAGTTGDFFWDKGDAKQYAWFAGNADGETLPVDDARFKPNAWGLYHMAGNVWEWTQDCWHQDYRNAPPDGKAWEAANGGNCNRRVLRGGSWSLRADWLRSAVRLGDFAGGRDDSVGFRLAQDLP